MERITYCNRGTMFSVRSVPRCYTQDKSTLPCATRVEAGSNTSTVTLRVVGGDEKRSLKSETVKLVMSPKGLESENDYPGEDQQHI
jgi:hypothetical protein